MDNGELGVLDANRRARGGMDRSTYIRWLVAQDQKRIAGEHAVMRGPNFPVAIVDEVHDYLS